MQFCGCLLFSCLLLITLLHCSVDGFRVQQGVDQRTLRAPAPLRPPAHLRPRPGGVKAGEELTAKLLRLDDLVRMENDVMEPKRKRSFPGNNAPLDRLSVSSMEIKQGTNKQSKVVELPRRRVNPPPVDRIGMSRLPNSRG
ncbi:osteocrin [Epinephelus fuscoguttatus]|uniref:osteocrin n=1 Tax=Epinephelus fuscoguttatus TaxID=293821 RepID=UPI0020D08CB7|nr:osteocrin [Epinephelus fuscoguttatus]XP_049433610.1 osteocrin [Epinephelus fuscoguttatus]